MSRSGYWGSQKPPLGSLIDNSHPWSVGQEAFVTFAERTGATNAIASDLSGRGNRLTLSTATMVNRGLSLAGGSVEHAGTATATRIPMGATQPFTIGVRVAMTAATHNATIWGIGQIPTTVLTGQHRFFFFNNSGIYFWGDNADWNTGVDYTFDGQMHDYVFTATEGLIFLYIDGVQRGSTTRPANLVAGPQGVWAGSRHQGGSTTFTGVIEYGYVLSRFQHVSEAAGRRMKPYDNVLAPPWERYFYGVARSGGAPAARTLRTRSLMGVGM